MSDLWFTADLHFGHRFMAQLRHWGSIDTMDFTLISEWNESVKPNDEVWVLGDFSFRNQADTKAIFAQLNGHKHLVRGNHDPKWVDRLGWESIHDFRRVKHEGVSYYCFHYPMLTWPNAHHGTIHLHGHSHGNLRAPESTRMDVGPDATGKTVINVEEIAEIMATRSYDFIDHHN